MRELLPGLALLCLLGWLSLTSEPGHPSPPAGAKTFRTLLAVSLREREREEEEETTGATRRSRSPPGRAGVELVEQGVFWSERADRSPPAGFSERHVQRWQHRARSSRLVSLEKGCGRLSNRLATFSDGSRACVRYGINPDQVLGETLSFYLSRLLGVRNAPALALSRVNTNADQWARVRREVQAAQWADRPVVSLSEWIGNLSDVVSPLPLRAGARGLHPSADGLANVTERQARELAQWSDLIVFDYLTANFDRLASNLLSLQWDSRVMERSTNNLHRTPKGALVFIDNEAGLVHGYRVLPMWEHYHESLLKTLCIFRKETARRVAELHRSRDAAGQLLALYLASEPLAPQLGFLSEEHAQLLQSRTDRLYQHIMQCKAKYGQ
ncbi:four-jointed box protein 1 [Pristis pectinata]|uniref:four-jointed box protein 1 n=1 Tax=Pristis pectinata TaxID=685728 RepID=UPI00223D23F3|nr:four-jointed box protein 1 [Pristis pectinata]XP_051885184.1 four-jointed box protein 1 [Pristis pectinata]XP_051885185.1 four-jointed box protein 1 [Pristis pectinata]